MLADCVAMAALVAVAAVVDVVVAGAITEDTGLIKEEEVVVRTGSGSMSTGSRCADLPFGCLCRQTRRKEKRKGRERENEGVVEIKEKRKGCRYPDLIIIKK